MEPLFTPGAMRVLQLAERLAGGLQSAQVEPGHLLWSLWLDESRGAELLATHGVSSESLDRHLPLPNGFTLEELPTVELPQSTALEDVVIEARQQVALLGKHVEIGSEHLLHGLTIVDSPVRDLLQAHGLRPESVSGKAAEQTGETAAPIAAGIQLSLEKAAVSDLTDVYRVIDASANRLREGLRVLEDYVRFSLDDRHLMSLLKNWRHRLVETLARADSHSLLSARDTREDVGTDVRTRREGLRESILDVVHANFKRAQESARTLEEYGKILSPDLGRRLGQLRYELYTLEKAVLLTHSSRERLAGRDLYLLVSESLCPHGSGPVIRAALAGGVGIIQVREKKLPDRDLVAHGRRVREWTAKAGALFIMNDRPDLAVLTDADGVHVGQEELTVREARRIVGPNKLVGVSTHTIEQARQAVLDGADYIGVGPVFSSSTKSFPHLAGLDFAREVAEEISLPAFAIGGITPENVERVVSAGLRRAAVSGAICGADDPEGTARELLSMLRSADG